MIKYQDLVVQGPQHADSKDVFEFIRDETPEEEPILFSKPRVLALYTGRSSAANYPRCEEHQIRKLLSDHDINLLLTNRFLGNSALDSFLIRHPDEMDLMFSIPVQAISNETLNDDIYTPTHPTPCNFIVIGWLSRQIAKIFTLECKDCPVRGR